MSLRSTVYEKIAQLTQAGNINHAESVTWKLQCSDGWASAPSASASASSSAAGVVAARLSCLLREELSDLRMDVRAVLLEMACLLAHVACAGLIGSDGSNCRALWLLWVPTSRAMITPCPLGRSTGI
jgi:hypothetical protein